MRTFKIKVFSKWAKKAGLSDEALKKALEEIDQGLFEADLGRHLFKKRIAKSGQGKRGGYRTIVLFKKNQTAFFLYGFEKNKKSNLSKQELEGYKMLSDDLLKLKSEELAKGVEQGLFLEVDNDE